MLEQAVHVQVEFYRYRACTCTCTMYESKSSKSGNTAMLLVCVAEEELRFLAEVGQCGLLERAIDAPVADVVCQPFAAQEVVALVRLVVDQQTPADVPVENCMLLKVFDVFISLCAIFYHEGSSPVLSCQNLTALTSPTSREKRIRNTLTSLRWQILSCVLTRRWACPSAFEPVSGRSVCQAVSLNLSIGSTYQRFESRRLLMFQRRDVNQ